MKYLRDEDSGNYRHADIASALIADGADVNVFDMSGHTALIFASELGGSKMVRVLTEGGTTKV